jgi:hypothetical protein
MQCHSSRNSALAHGSTQQDNRYELNRKYALGRAAHTNTHHHGGDPVALRDEVYLVCHENPRLAPQQTLREPTLND